MISSAFVFAFAFMISTASASISDCGVGKSVFQITGLSLDPPTQAAAGDNVTLGLFYNSPVAVQNGTVKTSITYNFLPLSPSITSLCDSIPCPIDVGSHDGSSWYLMPSGLSGTLSSKIVWSDMNNNQLLCIQMSLKASSKSKGKSKTKA
jgi:hypothetical protein